MAANVDTLLIVTGLDGDFSPRRMERYLVLAAECGVEPALILSKADLADAAELARRISQAREVAAGHPVVPWSSFDSRPAGAITECVGRGKTAALVGSSGTGKSTMINRLLGYDALATQPVSGSDGRGRHTTTRRELILLPQGWLIVDMPGLREVGLWASGEALEQVFEDVSGRADACRFRDCTHTTEPGCAVLAALDEGEVDGARLSQHRALRRELSELERRREARIAERAFRQMKREGWKP
jgi:ribosome biogenesis GTPase